MSDRQLPDKPDPADREKSENEAPSRRDALRLGAGAMLAASLAISSSGQGGASRSLRADSTDSRAGVTFGGSQHHGAARSMVFSSAVTPKTAARPRHWLTMPARPSLTIHVVGDRSLVRSAPALAVSMEGAFVTSNSTG